MEDGNKMKQEEKVGQGPKETELQAADSGQHKGYVGESREENQKEPRVDQVHGQRAKKKREEDDEEWIEEPCYHSSMAIQGTQRRMNGAKNGRRKAEKVCSIQCIRACPWA